MFKVQTLEQFLMCALGLLVGLIALVFALKKLLCWMDQQGWIEYSGNPSTYGTVANVLLELQALAQPQIEYVLEQKQEQEQKKEQDDQGGPDDPTRHLRSAPG